MQLPEAIKLIQHTISLEKATWADLGCGDGLFTTALSHMLPENSLIYAVDKNKRSLNNATVKDVIRLKKMILDFVNESFPLKDLSGIMMANSFHFVKDKNKFIKKVFDSLSANGYFIMVEYDTDRSNLWVPYPLSFKSLSTFFENYNCTTQKLHEMSSSYSGKIYSAIVRRNKN